MDTFQYWFRSLMTAILFQWMIDKMHIPAFSFDWCVGSFMCVLCYASWVSYEK